MTVKKDKSVKFALDSSKLKGELKKDEVEIDEFQNETTCGNSEITKPNIYRNNMSTERTVVDIKDRS